MSCKTLKHILIISVIMLVWACSLPIVRTEYIPDSHIPLNIGVKDASFLTNMEKEIVVELNAIRTNPKQYVQFLKSLRGSPQWSEGLEETILFVEKKEPMPVFRVSKGLSLAARDLVNDRGPEGLTGHTGKDLLFSQALRFRKFRCHSICLYFQALLLSHRKAPYKKTI